MAKKKPGVGRMLLDMTASSIKHGAKKTTQRAKEIKDGARDWAVEKITTAYESERMQEIMAPDELKRAQKAADKAKADSRAATARLKAVEKKIANSKSTS